MNSNNLILLERDKYNIIQQYFDLNTNNLVIKSIINNNTPSIIYVDSIEQPNIALIWNKTHNMFMLGNCLDKNVEDSIKTVFREVFFNCENKINKNILDYEIQCYSNEVEKRVEDIFDDFSVMLNQRRYYFMNLLNKDYFKEDNNFLEQYNLRLCFIDKIFLENKIINNKEDIITEINETWSSMNMYFKNGFGMCLVKDNDVVSWCTSDYVVGDSCEIGVKTDENFRKKGLCTYLVKQILNYCKKNKLYKVGWHCRADNIGSYKTAEKVGFIRKEYINVYHGWYNSFDNNLVNGYFCLSELKKYELGANFYEKAFSMLKSGHKDAIESNIFKQVDNVKWCYYMTARCWSLAGDKDKAFSNLYKSIDEGMSDIDMIKKDKCFLNLHSDKRWLEMI